MSAHAKGVVAGALLGAVGNAAVQSVTGQWSWHGGVTRFPTTQENSMTAMRLPPTQTAQSCWCDRSNPVDKRPEEPGLPPLPAGCP